MTPESISSAALRARRTRSASGEIGARVAAEHFVRICGDLREHAFVARAQHGDRVGEIKFAMRVFGTQRREARPQFFEREAIDRGIHLADGALLRREAGVFDDGLDAAFGVAHDPAVRAGIGKLGGENRGGGFAAAVRIEQGRERFGAQQRRVAGEHDRELRAFANRAPRDLHGVPRAALRFLQDRVCAPSCSASAATSSA